MLLRQWILHLAIIKNKPFNNFKLLLRKNNMATFSSFVVRRHAMKTVPVPFDTRLIFYDWWVLLHISTQHLFYLDDKTVIYWRQHNKSTLGKQCFHAHQRMVVDFFSHTYEHLEKYNQYLHEDKRKILISEMDKLHLFKQFYASPKPNNFLRFFIKDPIWSLDSLASCIINYFKSL